MVEPRIVPRAEHPISRRDIDPDALKVLYRLRQVDHIAYLVGGSVRDLLLGRRRRTSTSALGASVPGQEAVPELLDHRPALPPRAREVRHEGHRGRDVPAAGRGRARKSWPGRRAGAATRRRAGRRAPDPPRQHVRHARGGRVPPRLHDQRARSTTSRRSRSSTTSAASTICARGVVRSIGDPDVALPRGSGADAARDRARRAPRLHDRSAAARRHPRASPRDRARARRRACSRSTTRFCAPGSSEQTFREPRGGRPARADLGGAAPAAPPSRCGDRSRRSTPTAAGSSRRPTR